MRVDFQKESRSSNFISPSFEEKDSALCRLPLVKEKIDKQSPNLFSTTSDLLKSSSHGSLISCSQTFSELIPSASLEIQTPKPTRNEGFQSNLTALPNGQSMMDFALQNFHVSNRKFVSFRWKKDKNQGKLFCSSRILDEQRKVGKIPVRNLGFLISILFFFFVISEWTWQDYADLLKWSKVNRTEIFVGTKTKEKIFLCAIFRRRFSRRCFDTRRTTPLVLRDNLSSVSFDQRKRKIK